MAKDMYYFPVCKYGPEITAKTEGYLLLTMKEAFRIEKQWKEALKRNDNKHEINAYEIFVSRGIPA